MNKFAIYIVNKLEFSILYALKFQILREILLITYTMELLAGIGKKERERLSAVLRDAKGAISVAEVAGTLGVSNIVAAKMLARWAQKGWLSRICRGVYVPIPLESQTSDVRLEDPWVIAARLYSPCYIGGWSAAQYWDLTEQIFRAVVVITTRRPRDRKPNIKGTKFFLCTISQNAMFGLKQVSRGKVKIEVSDPTRTVLDMLNDPQLGGGIRSTVDMLANYLRSEKKDLSLLLDYAGRLGNGAVYKRLGFLLERLSPSDQDVIARCQERLTAGNAKLDTQLPADRLITRWRLWAPLEFLQERFPELTKQADDIAVRKKDDLSILSKLGVSQDALMVLIRRYHIKRLVLFGSAARGELLPSSDIDLLVEFEPGRSPSLGGMTVINDAFSILFGGRKIDLATPSILNNPYRRRAIEKDMEELYAA